MQGLWRDASHLNAVPCLLFFSFSLCLSCDATRWLPDGAFGGLGSRQELWTLLNLVDPPNFRDKNGFVEMYGDLQVGTPPPFAQNRKICAKPDQTITRMESRYSSDEGVNRTIVRTGSRLEPRREPQENDPTRGSKRNAERKLVTFNFYSCLSVLRIKRLIM